jgi:hypothetical protein
LREVSLDLSSSGVVVGVGYEDIVGYVVGCVVNMGESDPSTSYYYSYSFYYSYNYSYSYP